MLILERKLHLISSPDDLSSEKLSGINLRHVFSHIGLGRFLKELQVNSNASLFIWVI